MKLRTALVTFALVSLPMAALAQTSGPTTPPNLVAVPTYNSTGDNMVGYDGIQLNWGASSAGSGIVGYTVKRALTSSLSTSTTDLPDAAQLATVTGTTYWDNTALGHTQYTYTVTAIDGDKNTSVPARVDILTPYGKGARVKTTVDTTVYSYNAKSGKMQKGGGKSSQSAGALGTELSGPVTIDVNPKSAVTYYQVDFDNGPDGYVDGADVIGSDMASADTGSALALANMQMLLNNLETQLRGILAKVETLKAALLAAAGNSQ